MLVQPVPADILQYLPDSAGINLVYSHLRDSDNEGQAVYFANADTHPRKPAFLVGLAGQAYLGIHASSRPHSVENDVLMLQPADGAPAERSPLGSRAARAVGISRHVGKRLKYRIYVVPIAIFTGKIPGPEVEAWAAEHHVPLLHQVDNLVDRLSRIARDHSARVDFPPTKEEISQVMEFFRSHEPPPDANSQVAPEGAGEPGPDGPPGGHPARCDGECVHPWEPARRNRARAA